MRLRALLRTQPRRALLQSAQALPRYRHTLRQTRQKFPCRSAASCDYNLAQLKTGPSYPNELRKFLQTTFQGAAVLVLLNNGYHSLHFVLDALELRDRCLDRAPFCGHIAQLLSYLLLMLTYFVYAAD